MDASIWQSLGYAMDSSGNWAPAAPAPAPTPAPAPVATSSGGGSSYTPTPTVDPIAQMYQQYLGRAPDAAGLQYWTGMFGSDVDASELQQFLNAASKSETGWTPSVDAVYQQYLGRAPDEAGKEYWTRLFGNEVDPAELQQWLDAASKTSPNDAINKALQGVVPSQFTDGMTLSKEQFDAMAKVAPKYYQSVMLDEPGANDMGIGIGGAGQYTPGWFYIPKPTAQHPNAAEVVNYELQDDGTYKVMKTEMTSDWRNYDKGIEDKFSWSASLSDILKGAAVVASAGGLNNYLSAGSIFTAPGTTGGPLVGGATGSVAPGTPGVSVVGGPIANPYAGITVTDLAKLGLSATDAATAASVISKAATTGAPVALTGIPAVDKVLELIKDNAGLLGTAGSIIGGALNVDAAKDAAEAQAKAQIEAAKISRRRSKVPSGRCNDSIWSV
jgi:hypothetical protein